ncbi:hypothetical protein TEA_019967 [Camellia sinensis var. sinensis]|uniref:rRNA methyltransferase 2, mitochondrial n=1 Tax=Camellia sinensis var. sinensis TaxID=542762 RepID=A0A4S4DY22_CAMSN|nr:hypothetical protein TEA_019967 [Camellia sinensis var. sinensis]
MSGAGAPDFFYREAQRLGYVARSAFKQLLQMQKQYKLIKPGSSILDLGCAPGAWLQVACQSLGPLKNGGVVVGIDLKKVKVPSLHCDARVRTVCADVMNLPKCQVKALSPQHFVHINVINPVPYRTVPYRLVCTVSKAKQYLHSPIAFRLKYRPIPAGKHNTGKKGFYLYQQHTMLSYAMQLGFSVILSDMCPLVSGITTKDAALSAELGMRALDLAVGGTAILDDIIQRERQSDGSDSSPDDRGVLKRGGHLIIKFLESEDVQEFSRICKPLFRKASWLRPKATRSSSREIYLICQAAANSPYRALIKDANFILRRCQCTTIATKAREANHTADALLVNDMINVGSNIP